MIKIESDRLKVEILEPDSTVYDRTRFDWTGFVTQVTLDGKHTFCIPESPKPGHGTGGIGLCNEFGSSIPIGYDDAKPGDQFPKIGVGLLERIDETDYSSFYPYPNQPFPMRFEAEPSAATFIVDPLPIRGYAVRLTKRLEAVGNRLLVHSKLTNVGEKRIVTQEYNHNFVGIDHSPFGPGYALEVPFDLALNGNGHRPLNVQRGLITWPETPASAYCFGLTGFAGSHTPFWELRLSTSGVSMREQTSFDWARCVLFGTRDLVSTEVFVAIDIVPGQTQEWTREYSFSTLADQEHPLTA